MRLPAYDDLEDEQLEVLEHPLDEPLFVAGPPGSGKTVLSVARARSALEAARSAAVVTYNRMLRRLVSQLNENETPTKTMHSLVYLDYLERTGSRPKSKGVSGYEWDWDEMMSTLAKMPRPEPNYNTLVVDEAQDLPEQFFSYAGTHVAGALTIFADDDQALSTRRSTLEQIQRAGKLPRPILLTENHRNSPEIAAVAEHFHEGRLPAADVKRPRTGSRPRLIGSPSVGHTAGRIATTFTNRGGTIGVVVYSNNTGRELHRTLRGLLPRQRVDHYENQLQNENQIDLLSTGITIVNKESVKGQEFDRVFVVELEEFVPCTSPVMKRVMYMLCSRARDELVLVYGKDGLSTKALAALPPSEILERG